MSGRHWRTVCGGCYEATACASYDGDRILCDSCAVLDGFIEPPPKDGEGHLDPVPRYPLDALPGPMRSLVEYGAAENIPAALVGGSALAAVAAAIGPRSVVELRPTWHERAILWVANVAPRGAGKTPAQSFAFAPLRAHDKDLQDDEPRIRAGDTTLEALARSLAATDGGAALDLDELAVLLRGMGEYKRGGGGDTGRFLSLWSGGPWDIARVGASKGASNGLRLHIARPTLVICGGLQPSLHELLGGDADGMRPRWLPHLAEMPEDRGRQRVTLSLDYAGLVRDLLGARDIERTWTLTRAAEATFDEHRRRWKHAARKGMESAAVSAALGKADVHLARIALVFAEVGCPGGVPNGAPIEPETIDRAARIIDLTLDSWRALPEQGGFALSRRDVVLDEGVSKLVAWLDEHGGEATRRQLQRARVAGARTAGDLDALLRRYEDRYPGTVKRMGREHGGPPTAVVRAPMRRRLSSTVATGDNGRGAAGNPHSYAESGTVATGDSAVGDSAGDSTDPDVERAERAIRRQFPGAGR